jgi:hypothetical protein
MCRQIAFWGQRSALSAAIFGSRFVVDEFAFERRPVVFLLFP